MNTLYELASNHPNVATGFTIAGVITSFVNTATPVLQFVSALAACVLGVVTTYAQIRKYLDERKGTDTQG